MKTQPTTEDLISYAHGVAAEEACDLLEQLCREDFTAGEMIALGVILRGAFDRREALERPPADLKVVRPGKRKRA